MSLFTRRPGGRVQVRSMPGCLVSSLILSITLTILVNLIIRIL